MKPRDMSPPIRPPWRPEYLERVRPELAVVPPCRDCGTVPKIYARFPDGTVCCAGDARRLCYETQRIATQR